MRVLRERLKGHLLAVSHRQLLVDYIRWRQTTHTLASSSEPSNMPASLGACAPMSPNERPVRKWPPRQSSSGPSLTARLAPSMRAQSGPRQRVDRESWPALHYLNKVGPGGISSAWPTWVCRPWQPAHAAEISKTMLASTEASQPASQPDRPRIERPN